jgi:toxin YhaV
VIPADPNAPDFRLRGELKLFRRLKGRGLPDRYRLFYVFSSTLRVIIMLYLNDESSLQQEGGRNDPYARFTALVRQGRVGKGITPNWEKIFEALRQ